MTIPRDPEKAKALGEMNEQEEQEIEEIAKIFCDKDYCSDSDDNQYPGCKILKNGGCTNKSYVDQILSLIERTHIRKDTKIDCPYCNRPYHTVGCPCVNFKIKVGELVEGK